MFNRLVVLSVALLLSQAGNTQTVLQKVNSYVKANELALLKEYKAVSYTHLRAHET
jgi:hypothetical protein